MTCATQLKLQDFQGCGIKKTAQLRRRAAIPALNTLTKMPGGKIIVTRPEPDGTAFGGLAREYGLEPIFSPAMRIEIADAPLGPDGLDDIAALAFTSANGVRAFAANTEDRKKPVFAVGAATAAAARKAGFKSIEEAQGETRSLADSIENANRRVPLCGAVLHVAGRDHAGDLVRDLEERTIRARRLVLYAAVPVERLSVEAIAAIENGGVWISLFSPRSAAIFMRQAEAVGVADRLRRCAAACLSLAVAKEIDGFGDVVIAPQRRADALLAAIARHAAL